MSIEALWYSSYKGSAPPVMRRLSRKPMARQWDAAIELAIAHADGTAGYRPIGGLGRTGEKVWYWPQPDGDWWLIPRRVERRCLALVRAATGCEIARGHGRATGAAVVARLRRWRATGHWRRVAATFSPRHGTPGKDLSIFAPPRRRRGRAPGRARS